MLWAPVNQLAPDFIGGSNSSAAVPAAVRRVSSPAAPEGEDALDTAGKMPALHGGLGACFAGLNT